MTTTTDDREGAGAQLIELLDLERLEDNLFRGRPGPGAHVFGGQVLGQAIIAAARTVDHHRLHSLHAYFLRPGDSARPILFEVDRIRDGGSFASRRVVGIQHGRGIFSMSSSHQRPEEGVSHQSSMPAVAPPDGLATDRDFYDRLAQADPSIHRFAFRFAAVDSRQVEGIRNLPRNDRSAHPPRKHTWVRVQGTLPDRPELHDALLGYLSDLDFMSVALLPHGPRFGELMLQGASLDHSLWLHRPFRADEWLLFEKHSSSAAGGRGFVRGSFFDSAGALVASAAQECLMRVRPRGRGPG